MDHFIFLAQWKHVNLSIRTLIKTYNDDMNVIGSVKSNSNLHAKCLFLLCWWMWAMQLNWKSRWHYVLATRCEWNGMKMKWMKKRCHLKNLRYQIRIKLIRMDEIRTKSYVYLLWWEFVWLCICALNVTQTLFTALWIGLRRYGSRDSRMSKCFSSFQFKVNARPSVCFFWLLFWIWF